MGETGAGGRWSSNIEGAGRRNNRRQQWAESQAAQPQSVDSTSVEVTSEWTTWSECTETLEVTSEADRWRELRFRLEPVIIIARTTTPFLTGTEKRRLTY